jgi:hypothetical protein
MQNVYIPQLVYKKVFPVWTVSQHPTAEISELKTHVSDGPQVTGRTVIPLCWLLGNIKPQMVSF